MQKVIGSLRRQTINSCHCPQCFSHMPGTAVRRAGNVTYRGGRTTLLTSTTLLCSSICTAGAVLDADSKIRRTQQWDEAIAELEERVAEAKRRNDAITTLVNHTSWLDLAKGIEADSRTRAIQQWDEEITGLECLLAAGKCRNDAIHTLVDPNLRWLDLANGRQPVPISTGRNPEKNMIGWHSSHHELYGQRLCLPTWAPHKIAIVNMAMEVMVVKLRRETIAVPHCVEQILQVLDNIQGSRDNIPRHLADVVATRSSSDISRLREWLTAPRKSRECSDLEDQLADLLVRQRSLQKGEELRVKDTLARFAARKPSETKVKELNEYLLGLFRSADETQTSRYLCLALACDALRTAGTMPHTSTYNILIAGLAELNIEHTANIAIHALRRSHMRPNEVSLSLILQHYTRQNDRSGFEKWLAWTRGEAPVVRWAKNRKKVDLVLRQNDDALPEKEWKFSKRLRRFQPSALVFSAMIAGKVHFNGIQEALRMYYDMNARGWGLSFDALGPLLRDCAARKDVPAGEQLWRVARRLQRSANHLLNDRGNFSDRIPRHVYDAMLSLYDVAGTEERRDSILREYKLVWSGFPSISPGPSSFAHRHPMHHTIHETKDMLSATSTTSATAYQPFSPAAIHATEDAFSMNSSNNIVFESIAEPTPSKHDSSATTMHGLNATDEPIMSSKTNNTIAFVEPTNPFEADQEQHPMRGKALPLRNESGNTGASRIRRLLSNEESPRRSMLRLRFVDTKLESKGASSVTGDDIILNSPQPAGTEPETVGARSATQVTTDLEPGRQLLKPVPAPARLKGKMAAAKTVDSALSKSPVREEQVRIGMISDDCVDTRAWQYTPRPSVRELMPRLQAHEHQATSSWASSLSPN